MSSENPGSGWPPAVTTNYSGDEWVNTPDIEPGPEYEVFTGNSDFAAPAYSGYSSYPGNISFTATTGASVTPPTSMEYPVYSPNEFQYSNSNLDHQEAINSTSYQNQSL
jgi:hypothetical protein